MSSSLSLFVVLEDEDVDLAVFLPLLKFNG